MNCKDKEQGVEVRTARKKKGYARLLLGAALFFTGFVLAGSSTGSPEIYGPYICTACSLGTPVPDAATNAYINSMDYSVNNNPLNIFVDNSFAVAGDQFIICNATACVTYTRTHSNHFDGASPRPRTSSGGGGGSGGGTPVGGSGPGAPGCVYGCGTGTVTVGSPKNADQ